jgi:hypothetical protein
VNFRRMSIGCMGATEVAPVICKRYQTNELAVDSTEFGTRGSEVQILSPRPILKKTIVYERFLKFTRVI